MDEGFIRKIILADGTELPDSECGYADHTLWCYIKNKSMGEVFGMFSDPEKTSYIHSIFGSQEREYVGFTELNLIQQSEFTVDVRLLVPAN